MDLPESAGPAHGGVRHVVLRPCRDALDGIVVRAVARAVQQHQAGMLLQVGDLAA